MLKIIYSEFINALKYNDRGCLLKILKENPKFHNYVGEDGDLIEVTLLYNKKLLGYVFRCGLNPDVGQKKPLQTFLQNSIAEGNMKYVKLAIKHGADIERKNIHGETALGYACNWGKYKIVRYLIKMGAKINEIEKSSDGFCTTALDAALDVSHGYPKIVKYLRSKGARTYQELKNHMG
jgi:hypothetical protein